VRELVIIGSGPAGYTAAIYAARADLKPLVIASSVEMGGDLMKTTDVDNYPGFPEGVMGPDLMMGMQAQAERFGAELVFDDATVVELDGPVKKITLGNGDVIESNAVILSMGSQYRHLGLDDREAFVRFRRLIVRYLRRRVLPQSHSRGRWREGLGDGRGDVPDKIR